MRRHFEQGFTHGAYQTNVRNARTKRRTMSRRAARAQHPLRWRHGVSARHHDLRGSDTFGEGRQHGGATMAVTGSVRELPSLEHAAQVAQQLRVDGIRASTKAGSGHPTSSMSAADLVAVLATRHLRYDFGNPREPNNDHLIFSKG